MVFISKKIFSSAPVLAFLVSAGCATTPRVDPYASALTRAFDELSTPPHRAPSSAEVPTTLPAFQGLRGRIDILVFPRVSNQLSMNSDERIESFASPIRFSITAQRLLNCGKLLQEKTRKWAHQQFFGAEIDRSLDCGILEVRQTAPEILKANQRDGDPIAARVYIDSEYHVHGLEMEIYRSRKQIDTSRIQWDPTESSSSGLGLFPIDIPNLSRHTAKEGPLPVPGDSYIQSKMKKFGAESCSNAQIYRYRDYYGNRNTVAWCSGNAWPTVISNSRFFSILVRK